MTYNSRTVDRLRSLIRLYDQEERCNQVVDQAVQKLFDLEMQRTRNETARLQARLAAYEQQHGLSSAEFYRRFRAGELDDTMDFVEWSTFWDMFQAAQQRLDDLAAQAA